MARFVDEQQNAFRTMIAMKENLCVSEINWFRRSECKWSNGFLKRKTSIYSDIYIYSGWKATNSRKLNQFAIPRTQRREDKEGRGNSRCGRKQRNPCGVLFNIVLGSGTVLHFNCVWCGYRCRHPLPSSLPPPPPHHTLASPAVDFTKLFLT